MLFVDGLIYIKNAFSHSFVRSFIMKNISLGQIKFVRISYGNLILGNSQIK